MLLEEIVVHNFAGYRGRQSILLTPPSADRPIVLFGGMNGAGKTTLLDALQLVLFGRRAQCATRGALAYDEYLRRCVHRGASATEGAALELQFRAGVGGEESIFRVHRSWEAKGRSVREHLDVYRNDELDPILSDQWAELVEEIIPADIAPLFFFDGEKIEALADPERSARVIGTAIEALLGLNLLERLSTDLIALERRKRTASADSEDQLGLKQLEADVVAARAERRTTLQELAARQNDVDRAMQAEKAAHERFRREGGELFARRTELEQRRAALIERLTDLDHQLSDVAAGPLPLRLVQDLLYQVVRQHDVEVTARRASILGEVLAERDAVVLSKMKHELAKDAHERLEAMLNADREKRATAAKTVSYLHLSEDAEQRLAFVWPVELDRASAVAEKLLVERRAIVGEIETCDRELAGVPSEDAIAAAVRERDVAWSTRVDAQARLAIAGEAVAAATRRLADTESSLERRLRDASGALAQHEDAERTVRHAVRVRETLTAFRARLLDRHLQRIEAAVLDSFRQLLRKRHLVADIRLNPETFELTIFDRHGAQISSERLSAGERQLLAISLLWGLARVSGKRLPTVVDTPLGRLDSSHRWLLVERYFPKASDQVILLSTDKEIDEELFRVLAPFVGHRYELQHDDVADSTRVVNGYFWETPDVA